MRKRGAQLCSYYRRFIKDFAQIAKPLHDLTGENKAFRWGPEQTASFETPKEKLTSASVLSSPTPDGRYVLDTDARCHVIGGVLQQVPDG